MDAPARDHEDLLALLAAGVEDCAIMLLDADGYVRTWNERAPRFQGYLFGEIVGRHVSVSTRQRISRRANLNANCRPRRSRVTWRTRAGACVRTGRRIDLDQFKSVNDRLGHTVGDRLLINVARIMQSRTRDTDVLTRLGGDEFALLMSEGGEADAKILAGDLSDLIRRRSIVLEGGLPGGITASVGIAVFDERESLRAEDMLAEADSAMYTAKHGGRDRIAAYVTEDGVRHQSAARLTLGAGASSDRAAGSIACLRCQPTPRY